jgi:hypothetical protein
MAKSMGESFGSCPAGIGLANYVGRIFWINMYITSCIDAIFIHVQILELLEKNVFLSNARKYFIVGITVESKNKEPSHQMVWSC